MSAPYEALPGYRAAGKALIKKQRQPQSVAYGSLAYKNRAPSVRYSDQNEGPPGSVEE